ncbi:MAG: hypothetical protein AAF558_09930, partial [Verrucomicrobiota bacterium]
FSASDKGLVVSGKVNLNQASPEVVKSILLGASKDIISNAVVSNVDDLSNGIGSWLAGDKVTSPSSIASELGPGISQSNFGSQDDAFIKVRREAVARALVGSHQNRTWNFLIDLIAQSGRINTSGASPSSEDFLVEGEKRFWVFVAIDRLTGKIVRQQIEPVTQ